MFFQKMLDIYSPFLKMLMGNDYISSQTSTVYVWNTEKGKLIGNVKTGYQSNSQINEISINPFGRSIQVCIIGNGILRVFKFEDPTFKLVHQVKLSKVI